MSSKYALKIPAGATFACSFVYLVGDPPAPYPLDGYVATLQIRPSPRSAETVIEKELPIDTATAAVSLVLSANETSLLTAPSYVYGIELVAAGGEPVIRLAQGSISPTPEVVR